jgi:hypothetical protein
MQVWPEAAGPYESEVDLEVARAFNISRRFAEVGRRKDLEEIMASVATQGGVTIKEEWAKEVKKKWRKGMICFKAMRREPDCGYWHKNGNFVDGERVEIQCGGCFAKFVSEMQDPQGQLDDWKVHRTRRDYFEHRRRAFANRDALALYQIRNKSNIVAERSMT